MAHAAPTTKSAAPRTGSVAPYVWGISTAAALAGLLFGFDTAVINGALVFLKQQLSLTDGQTEAAATALLVGALAGSGIAGPLTDRYGRRRLLLYAAGLFCVSSIWTAIPSSLVEFGIARFAAGLAIGVASVLAPMYIAEIAPARIRGQLVTLNQMAIVTGIVASYAVNWLLSGLGPSSWRWMFATAALPSVAFFVALLFIPESPRWLMRWRRDQEAVAILRRVAGEAEAEPAAAEIRASLAGETGTYRELLDPGMRRPLTVAILLAIFSQITGINTVIYYGGLLFQEHGGRGAASDALGANVIIGVVNFLMTIVAIAFVDRLGRRPLLLTGCAGMGVSLLVASYCFGLTPVPAAAILGSILAYVAFFAVSLGPGSWLYISEIFPTAVRGRAMSAATFALWGACIAVTFTFLTMVKSFGAAGAFRVYAAICAVAFVFVWRYLPETKGRTLEDISRNWRA